MRWYEIDSYLGSETVVQLKERIKRLEKKLADSTRRGGGFVSTSPPSPPPSRGPVGDVTIHVDIGADPDTEDAIRAVMAEHAREAMRR